MNFHRILPKQRNGGQALVVLLVFMTVGVMVTFATTLLSAYSITLSSSSQLTDLSVDVAESGMENAILRLLRDPAYTGETLTLPDGTATITVTGTSTKTITSVGVAGNYRHTVVTTATYVNGILSLSQWVDSY
jgi:hypothetical protein